MNSLSIRDHLRLGKFKADNVRPRPVMVKRIRSADAASILYKARSLKHLKIFVQPDMTRNQ